MNLKQADLEKLDDAACILSDIAQIEAGNNVISAAVEISELRAEITRLQKALDTARKDALEEAAKVAEQLPMLRAVSPVHVKSTSPQDVADFIRALKDKEVAG